MPRATTHCLTYFGDCLDHVLQVWEDEALGCTPCEQQESLTKIGSTAAEQRKYK